LAGRRVGVSAGSRGDATGDVRRGQAGSAATGEPGSRRPTRDGMGGLGARRAGAAGDERRGTRPPRDQPGRRCDAAALADPHRPREPLDRQPGGARGRLGYRTGAAAAARAAAGRARAPQPRAADPGARRFVPRPARPARADGGRSRAHPARRSPAGHDHAAGHHRPRAVEPSHRRPRGAATGDGGGGALDGGGGGTASAAAGRAWAGDRGHRPDGELPAGRQGSGAGHPGPLRAVRRGARSTLLLHSRSTGPEGEADPPRVRLHRGVRLSAGRSERAVRSAREPDPQRGGREHRAAGADPRGPRAGRQHAPSHGPG